MNKIVVLGKPEFTLGFALTGIRDGINVTDINKDVKNCLSNDDMSIVIMDEDSMGELDPRIKEDVVASIKPVFVVVSTTSQQQELRDMILQAIGVDLLKD